MGPRTSRSHNHHSAHVAIFERRSRGRCSLGRLSAFASISGTRIRRALACGASVSCPQWPRWLASPHRRGDAAGCGRPECPDGDQRCQDAEVRSASASRRAARIVDSMMGPLASAKSDSSIDAHRSVPASPRLARRPWLERSHAAYREMGGREPHRPTHNDHREPKALRTATALSSGATQTKSSDGRRGCEPTGHRAFRWCCLLSCRAAKGRAAKGWCVRAAGSAPRSARASPSPG